GVEERLEHQGRQVDQPDDLPPWDRERAPAHPVKDKRRASAWVCLTFGMGHLVALLPDAAEVARTEELALAQPAEGRPLLLGLEGLLLRYEGGHAPRSPLLGVHCGQ